MGGTNTRVGLSNGPEVSQQSIRKYRNDDFSSLHAIITTHIGHLGVSSTDAACVAVAGPVKAGSGKLTNRNWSMSEADLARLANCEHGLVINDLSAQGYALDRTTVKPVFDATARMTPSETRLVVGIGTGFNAAPVYCDDGQLLVPPSEAGHITLPKWNDNSSKVASALTATHGFASVEDVLSGRGLPNVYEKLSGRPAPSDPGEILARGVEDPMSVEGHAVHTSIGTLARVLSDLALIFLPFGGIVLIGGVARILAPHFNKFQFEEGFLDKGRFSGFLRDFNIFTLEDDFAALTGCASHTFERLNPLRR
ncbi:MAG: glucokinase [Pseudomonadota bacterium]